MKSKLSVLTLSLCLSLTLIACTGRDNQVTSSPEQSNQDSDIKSVSDTTVSEPQTSIDNQHVSINIAENVSIDANIKIPSTSKYDVVKITEVDWLKHNITSEAMADIPRGFMSKLPFNRINQHFLQSNAKYLGCELAFMSRNEAVSLVQNKLKEANIPVYESVSVYGITDKELNEIYSEVIDAIDQLPENEKREGHNYTLPSQTFDFDGGWYIAFFKTHHDNIPIYNRQTLQFNAIPSSLDSGFGVSAPVVSAIISKNGIESLSLSAGISIQTVQSEVDTVISADDAIEAIKKKYSQIIGSNKITFKSISLEYIEKPVTFKKEDIDNRNLILTPVWIFEGTQMEGESEFYCVAAIDAITGEDVGLSESAGSFIGGF